MTRRRTFRARLIVLAALILTLAAPPARAPGPGDLEDTRRFIADDLLPTTLAVWEATACHYVGGSVIFHPPGLGDSGLVGCSDPWCHPWQIVSVMCIDYDRFVHPDPEYSDFCVVSQNVAPSPVKIPFQDAVSPIRTQCVDPLMRNSVYAGFCGFVVQAYCFEDATSRECAVYSSMVGCADASSGECTQPVQAICLGWYAPMDNTPPFRAVCLLWVDALKLCVTTSDGSMPSDQ
jgi:hypothetical protein